MEPSQAVVFSTAVPYGLCRRYHRITQSQNVRGWKGPLWVIWSNPPARAGSPTVGCTGPCPGGSWISPERENPQPPWAAFSRAPSPSEGRSSSSCSDGTSSASVCAHCPLSCTWAPLKRAWPHPPDTHPWDIYKHLLGPLSAFSSSGWTSSAPSATTPPSFVLSANLLRVHLISTYLPLLLDLLECHNGKNYTSHASW